MQNKDKTFTLLEEALFNNGFDYRVTLTTGVTVELFDRLNGATIGVTTENTLEAALTSLVSNILGRTQYVNTSDMLSRL